MHRRWPVLRSVSPDWNGSALARIKDTRVLRVRKRSLRGGFTPYSEDVIILLATCSYVNNPGRRENVDHLKYIDVSDRGCTRIGAFSNYPICIVP